MSGETDLSALLRGLKPTLCGSRWCFVCVKSSTTLEDCSRFHPLATFREKEGLTMVIEERNLNMEITEKSGWYACITLEVHSSLEAIGLTAKVSEVLTQHCISANIIAAYYHDHVFVPYHQREEAMKCLQALSQQTKE